MQRLTRSWSMMLAHATAFAALNCGGTLQHALWPGRYPALSFLVPIAMFALFVLIFRIIRSARLHCLNMAPCRGHLSRAEKWSQGKAQSTNAGPDEWAGGKTWAFETWDDETYDAEEDIAGVSVSFLLVQALRLNISGRLPDNFGVEEEHYMHGVAAIFGILLCGILFLVAHVAMVVTKYKTDEWSRLAKRCWVISQSALSMGFAWCLLYASQYTEARLLNNESPNTITERIILAFILSVVTLVLIFVLDKIADSGFQHKEVFYNIIMALSVLVGFSWEQCFDCAVENIGDRSKRPYVVNLALAFFLGLMVGIPWRRYVLSTVLWYEEERSKEAEASTD